MEQKRVSFKVAKAIKDAGYPQDNVPITEIGWYNIARVYTKQLPTYWEGDHRFVAIAPTYLDVWLWLWRDKRFAIPADYFGYDNDYWSSCVPISGNRFEFFEPHDPEEAIIAAIEYIVDHNLLSI